MSLYNYFARYLAPSAANGPVFCGPSCSVPRTKLDFIH